LKETSKGVQAKLTVEYKWARRDKEASICRYRRKPNVVSARRTTKPSEGAEVTRNKMRIGTNARGETTIEDFWRNVP
jgi:hypothetical protein